jgi:hypothetical protein
MDDRRLLKLPNGRCALAISDSTLKLLDENVAGMWLKYGANARVVGAFHAAILFLPSATFC